MILGKLMSKLDDVCRWIARHWILSVITLILHSWLWVQVGYAATPRIIEEVRFRSESMSTRVVIETNGALRYAVGRLPNPERLYIDLLQARLASGWQKKQLSVNDARIKAIRVAQYHRGVVRVVVDIKQIQTYKVFSLKQPYRIVIDLQGAGASRRPPPHVRAPAPKTPRPPAPAPKTTRAPAPKPAPRHVSQPTIVIDPGHGGKDPGALGPNGLREKTVVLQVAKALRQLIRKRLPRYRVIMTRETDVF